MLIDFSLAEQFSRKKEGIIKAINSDGLPLVLFGCHYDSAVESFLKKLHVDIPYICDNAIERRQSCYGCEAISPEDLGKRYIANEYNVFIIPAMYESEITQQLFNLPAPPKHIFCLDLYYYESDADYIAANEERIQKVYSLLSDNKSKETYQAVINHRLSRDLSFFNDRIALPRQTQYFSDDIISLNDHEVFIDCGAFNGDTIKPFIQRCKGKYKAIYAFEPESSNYKMLKQYAQTHKSIYPLHMGLSDKITIGYTNSCAMNSSISENGEECVRLDSIDHVLSTYINKNATFIKMDIEGFECKALKGAANTIKCYKPKLAICIYHSIDDIVNIPLLIHELEPGYSLYIRHYTTGIQETVCYAVYHS